MVVRSHDKRGAAALAPGLIALAIAWSASPAAHALGIVSRSCAPVGAQESVTVDWHFRPHYLWTTSTHYRNGVFLHTAGAADEGGPAWHLGWRAYAGHFGSDFWYGRVIGRHYAYRAGMVSFLGTSQATDCNLDQWG